MNRITTLPPLYSNAKLTDEPFVKLAEENKSVVFYGKAGTGKTTAAVGYARRLPPIGGKAQNIIFLDYLVYQLKMIADPGQKLAKVEKYIQDYDTIILDDIKLENLTEAKGENLDLLISFAYNYRRGLIITANYLRSEFEKYDARIYSRLCGMCEWIEFKGQDFRRAK